MTEDEGCCDDGDRHIDLEELDPLSLDEALGIIGEETRARIIMALGGAWEEEMAVPAPLSFSELMARVDAEDSGRFNYHLDKLVGTFVKKTDRGYALRMPGHLVYRAIIAGTLTERETIEPFTVGECPHCDGSLTAGYSPDHLLTVECEGCGELVDCIHFPKRGVEDRSKEELLDAAYVRRHGKMRTMFSGVCHNCGSPVTGCLLSEGADAIEEMMHEEVYANLACEGCNAALIGHPAALVQAAPEVAAFFQDHGRDVALVRNWDETMVGVEEATEILSEDPLRVEIPFEVDDERLRVVVGEQLDILAAERDSLDETAPRESEDDGESGRERERHSV